MWLLDKALRRLVKRGPLTVIGPDGQATTYGAPDPELVPVTVRFTDARAARQIVSDPGLGAAETWMDGRLLLEQGELIDLIQIIRRNNRWEERGAKKDSFLRKGGWLKSRLDQMNWQRRSRQNVAHHYDIGNELYRLFLDADWQYSCAYFTDPANSLEQAQRDKKAHIAAKLDLKPGMKVLDIGCGWGGLALYLHRHYGCEVLGVTLAEEQIKLARERAEAAGVADEVKFEFVDYRDVQGKFDRIVSVGMFEHVGPRFFRTFFEKCRDLLTEDGVMLLHTIGRMGKPGTTDRFTQKYIFPGGYVPALSEVMAASEGTRLIMSDCEILRLHYYHTIKHWYGRLEAHKDEVVALYDERFYRLWLFYLAAVMTMFNESGMVNYQLQYIRNRRTLPITRDYMVDEERRLRSLEA